MADPLFSAAVLAAKEPAMNQTSPLDRPIAYAPVDPDAPIPFRVRVLPVSQTLRDFVVPRHMPRPIRIPAERKSARKLRAA
jgi:hypothetical protein